MSNRRKSQICISLALLLWAAGSLLTGAGDFVTCFFKGFAIVGFILSIRFIRRAAKSGECPDNAFCRWTHHQLAKLKEAFH